MVKVARGAGAAVGVRWGEAKGKGLGWLVGGCSGCVLTAYIEQPSCRSSKSGSLFDDITHKRCFGDSPEADTPL